MGHRICLKKVSGETGNLLELRHAFYCQIFSIPVSLPLKLFSDVNNSGTASKQEKKSQLYLPASH